MIRKYLWIFPVFLSVGLYFRILGFEYVWDDVSLLTKLLPLHKNLIDPFTQEGLTGHAIYYYRPFLYLSLMLERALWGVSPQALHIMMLAIHAISTWLVYRIALHFLNSEAALVSATLFAVHPIHTEVIAWISARPDGYMTLFLLASLLFFLKFREEGLYRKRHLCLSLFCFFLALLSKETAAVFPLCIFLYDSLFFRGKKKFFIQKHHYYYGGLLLLFLILRHLYLEGISVPPLSSEKGGVEILQGMITAYGYYFLKTLLPISLNAFVAEISTYLHFFLGALLLAGSSIFLFFSIRRKKALLVTWHLFLFLILLFPAVSLAYFHVAKTSAAERYLFFPSYSFCFFAGLLMARSSRGKAKIFIGGLFLILALSYGYQTWQRIPVWENDIVFWHDATQKNPMAGLPFRNLAVAYQEKGDEEAALKYYRQVLETKADAEERSIALTGIGSMLFKMNRIDEAEGYFYQALETWPYAMPLCNLGVVYYYKPAPSKEEKKKLLEKSIGFFEKCIEAEPDVKTWKEHLRKVREEYGK